MNSDHARLVDLLALRSAKRGDFTLASGRRSNLYIDARLTSMSPDGQMLIGREGLALVRQRWGGAGVDAVGGLTLGADPIAYAIAHASALDAEAGGEWPTIRAFTVRKEAKQHGTGRQVEGPYRAGDRVVVVEDVITTGGSALKAIEVLRAHRARILGVLALVDREEGGSEAITAAGIEVLSMVRASEILPRIGPEG